MSQTASSTNSAHQPGGRHNADCLQLQGTDCREQSENRQACIDTLDLYRAAVDFFIALVLKRWDSVFVKEMPEQKQIKAMEQLCIRTKNRPDTPYDFSEKFYKFPSYLRRAAIRHAYGQVSSYMAHLETWTKNRHGNPPGLPRAGRVFPPLYHKNMFVRDKINGLYSARIKVFIRNTWDWMEVRLRKSDVDYLERYQNAP